jgi:hypothetical protein
VYHRALVVGRAGLGVSSALVWIAGQVGGGVVALDDYHPHALPDAFAADAWILLDNIQDPAHLDHLQLLATKYPNARIWAGAAETNTLPSGFTRLEIQPLNERELFSFAEAWFPRAANQESRINRRAQDFVASVQSNAGTRELATTPLDLFLLLQVYSPVTSNGAAGRSEAPAPSGKVSLHVTGASAPTPFDIPQRTTVSALPARRADLFNTYVNAILSSEPDPDLAGRALDGIALSTKRGQRAQPDHLERGYDFLVERASGRVEFKHRLLQDLFAARALRRNPDFEPMREHLSDPAWRDVARFYSGLGGADAVAGAAVAGGDLELAGEALAAVTEPEPQLLDHVVKALVSRVWEDHDDRSLRVLGRLRSNPASDFFAAKLRDKDPEVRRRAAFVLGCLHTDRALEYLLPQLRDPSADVRAQVIASLGQSRSERVVEPLLVALRGDPRVASGDVGMQIAAARALGEYGTEKAVPALIVDLQVGKEPVRAEAIAALEKIRSPFADKPLRSIAATDKRPEVRAAAARVLNDMDGHAPEASASLAVPAHSPK